MYISSAGPCREGGYDMSRCGDTIEMSMWYEDGEDNPCWGKKEVSSLVILLCVFPQCMNGNIYGVQGCLFHYFKNSTIKWTPNKGIWGENYRLPLFQGKLKNIRNIETDRNRSKIPAAAMISDAGYSAICFSRIRANSRLKSDRTWRFSQNNMPISAFVWDTILI